MQKLKDANVVFQYAQRRTHARARTLTRHAHAHARTRTHTRARARSRSRAHALAHHAYTHARHTLTRQVHGRDELCRLVAQQGTPRHSQRARAISAIRGLSDSIRGTHNANKGYVVTLIAVPIIAGAPLGAHGRVIDSAGGPRQKYRQRWGPRQVYLNFPNSMIINVKNAMAEAMRRCACACACVPVGKGGGGAVSTGFSRCAGAGSTARRCRG